MISVIIPTLNEGDTVLQCLERVLRDDPASEIIIADGGSSDRTAGVVRRHGGVKMVVSEKGRGMQMNAGAAAATGDILLFLHADTRIEEGWPERIASVLDDGSVAAGAFTLRIDSPLGRYRAVEQWVRLRCSACRLPYGDQGLFMKRDVFRKAGGFRNIPLMEDVDMIDRLKRIGRIVILPHKAYTSARRWERKGIVRTALLNQWIMMLYRFGVDPKRLARLYYGA